MALRNTGTQHMSLSAGIAQEPAPMTSRLMAQLFSVATASSAPSSWTARMSSVVVVAIEPTCSGLVGDDHACQLDGVDDYRRQPCCLR